MNRMEKLGKVIGFIGGMTMLAGFIYLLGIAGASDAERYTHEYHSFGWLVSNMLLGLSIFISGLGILKISEQVIVLSHKKYRRVWIRNIVSNKTISKLVEDGGNIVLLANEELQRVGRKVYCFR